MKTRYSFFQDSSGDLSSKRLMAGSCFVVAFVIAIIGLIFENRLALDLVDSFLWAGVALLIGGTAAEQIEAFSPRNKKQKQYEGE